MDNFVYVLSKQQNVSLERLHICTWTIEKDVYFTEYGLEINKEKLKKLDFQIALPLPQTLDNSNFICLYKNIIDQENCRFIFNAGINDISPINGQSAFGTRLEFVNDRKITALPLELNDNVTLDNNSRTLHITIDTSDEQITDTIYIRFLIKTTEPAFSYEKKEITRRIITNEVRVNECRTASDVVVRLQKNSYCPVQINKCFCFHIVPNSYSIDFIDDKKLKTIRSLEAVGFNNYLGSIKNKFDLSLKEHDYNIVFCKQEKSPNDNLTSYSFFSRYSKEYIGNIQVGLAITVNILCGLLIASGGLHQTDYSAPFFQRIALEYYISAGALLTLIIYLLYCRFWRKA